MSDTGTLMRAGTAQQSQSLGQGQIGNFDGIVERMLPLERLEREQAALKSAYDGAKPYPHLVIDNLWDPEVLDRIIAEFPRKGQRDWVQYDTPNELKQTSRGLFGLSPFTQMFMMEVCSTRFLKAVGAITGHANLVADPLFHGGGLHESSTGGWLNLHTDWRQHPTLPLARQLNMIIYLNKDWDPAWGGAIELWEPGASAAGAKTDCLYNRTLIFPTTDTSLHGFQDPIACPADRTRKSISLFYWTMDENAVKTAQNINFLPGKKQTKTKALIRSFVPPIAFEAKAVLNRLLKK